MKWVSGLLCELLVQSRVQSMITWMGKHGTALQGNGKLGMAEFF